ncbi:MAG: nicotinic acid mononucleotide adenylyltransferase [Rhodospirillaceae bacterium]|nr:nicotinic acid mononucleotide adenylyltransferase [Rhodospirillaceae bacterium]
MGNCGRQCIGLMGGSFNPAHSGHKMVAELALKRLRLNKIWWLVSPQNPLKSAQDMAMLKDRANLARQVARNPNIIVSTIESQLGTQYTIDILCILKKRYPKTRFVWIMGADNFIQFPEWKDWDKIARLVRIAVFDRPGFSLLALSGKMAHRFSAYRIYERQSSHLRRLRPPAWIFHHTLLNQCSATRIRSARMQSL